MGTHRICQQQHSGVPLQQKGYHTVSACLMLAKQQNKRWSMRVQKAPMLRGAHGGVSGGIKVKRCAGQGKG